MAAHIFIWWFVIEALGMLALPLASVLFGALPDRGYAFAKTLGLLLTGYGAWLLAMLGLAPFSMPLLVVCALIMAAIGAFAMRGNYAGAPGAGKSNVGEHIGSVGEHVGSPLRMMIGWMRAHWRLILGYEALFLVMLVFMALVRSYNPNPWGTERPMDFAFFNAIRRSEVFPPHDPWLAGFSINYYYFGYLLMAAMSLLSGLSSEVSFSLSLALVFALAALGIAGVGVNLIHLTSEGRRTNDEGGEARMPSSSIVKALAVLLAVVLVLFAGNQISALQVITGVKMVPALQGDELARAISNGVGARGPLYLDHEFKGWDFAGTSVVTPTNMLKDFDTWYPSRALWDTMPDLADPATPQRRYTITEFPFFSFWLGDMHPHVMALPFGLLALALALQTVARQQVPRFAHGRRGWLELALVGIVLGSLYAINSWDFPTYLLLFWGALLLLYLRFAPGVGHGGTETGAHADTAEETSQELVRSRMQLGFISPSPTLFGASTLRGGWQEYLIQAALVAVASLVMFLPFHLTFHSLVGSKAPLIDVPLLGRLTRTIGFVTWDKTPLYTFLIIFGLFLVPLLAYIGVQASRIRESQSLLWITLAALPVGVLLGFPLLFLLPLAVYAIMLAIVQHERPVTAFVLWAFALACLISFGAEIIYLRDVFELRINTIFKFYYQVWLILGVLAGYAVWWLLVGQRRSADHGFPRRLSLALVGVLFVVLLAAALIYPWETAGKAFLHDTRVGLAGQTPRQNTPAGQAAIAWLRANAPGDAVVLEVVGGDYDGSLGNYPGGLGAGGVSASTGLQNIINWPGHENQWRSGEPDALAVLGERQADVDTIYSTTDVTQARSLMQKYDVKYVYIGAAERATYSSEALAKFAQLGTQVFQQGDIEIYAVQ